MVVAAAASAATVCRAFLLDLLLVEVVDEADEIDLAEDAWWLEVTEELEVDEDGDIIEF